jgi:hypothetical protein
VLVVMTNAADHPSSRLLPQVSGNRARPPHRGVRASRGTEKKKMKKKNEEKKKRKKKKLVFWISMSV